MADDGGKKFDDGKVRLDLIPEESLWQIGKVMTHGASKYGDHNWRKGMSWSRLYAAARRHMSAMWQGEDFDPESGLLHLAHAGCCVLMLLAYQVCRLGTDDRTRDGGLWKK